MEGQRGVQEEHGFELIQRLAWAYCVINATLWLVLTVIGITERAYVSLCDSGKPQTCRAKASKQASNRKNLVAPSPGRRESKFTKKSI